MGLDINFAIKFHPATNNKGEVAKLFSSFKNLSLFSQELPINNLIIESKTVLCINSTVLYQLIYSDIPTISFMPYFIRKFMPSLPDSYVDYFCDPSISNVSELDDFELHFDVKKHEPMLFPFVGKKATKKLLEFIRGNNVVPK